MQNHQDRPDYPSVGDPSFPSHPGSGGAAGTAVSALDPYTPPNTTLCEVCRIGSHHTVDRWLGLNADVGILLKETGQGGKDRRSSSYTFLGLDRGCRSLPVSQPAINQIVALAQTRRHIERLEAELTLFRDGIYSDVFQALPTAWADVAQGRR